MKKEAIISALDEYADQSMADVADMRAMVLSQVRELSSTGNSHIITEESYSTRDITARGSASSNNQAPTLSTLEGAPFPIVKKPRKYAKLLILGWSPSIAATLVLILGCVVAGWLVVVNSRAGTQQSTNLLPNPGFEEGRGAWTFFSSGDVTKEFITRIDTTTVHSGKASVAISSTTSTPEGFAYLSTEIPTNGLTGKRVMFSGYVKTEGIYAGTTLNMVIMSGSGNTIPGTSNGINYASDQAKPVTLDEDTMNDRPILGTTDWTRYDLVLDVPAGATTIQFSLGAGGPGQIWLDDVELTEVGQDVATTSDFRNSAVVNSGFEDGLSGWGRHTQHLYLFEVGTDNTVSHSGNTSAFIRSFSTNSESRNSFYISQYVNAQNYRGQRVRFSAYMKSANLHGVASLMADAEDGTGTSVTWTGSGPVQAGTSDWQQYEVETDVPENSTYIYLELQLDVSGTVWIDDVQLESIGKIAPTNTNEGPNLLPNSGFEQGLGDWKAVEDVGLNFEVGSTNDLAHSGAASAYISSTTSTPPRSETLQTQFPTTGLLGKRIEFSGYIKTQGNANATSLGMNLTRLEKNAAQLTQVVLLDQASMDDRPILGNTDWTRYDLVLDVPSNATTIDFYLVTTGVGRVWLDDVQLVEVGNDVATTSSFLHAAFTNPGFEDGLTGWERDLQDFSDFNIGVDTTNYHSGKASANIRSVSNDPQSKSYSNLRQVVTAQPYKGQRVRFSAYIKGENLQGEAKLFADTQYLDSEGTGAEEVQWGPLVKSGTSDWQLYTVELDVPQDAFDLYLSFNLVGSGTVWIDDVQLESIGKIKPPTVTPTP